MNCIIQKVNQLTKEKLKVKTLEKELEESRKIIADNNKRITMLISKIETKTALITAFEDEKKSKEIANTMINQFECNKCD